MTQAEVAAVMVEDMKNQLRIKLTILAEEATEEWRHEGISQGQWDAIAIWLSDITAAVRQGPQRQPTQAEQSTEVPE